MADKNFSCASFTYLPKKQKLTTISGTPEPPEVGHSSDSGVSEFLGRKSGDEEGPEKEEEANGEAEKEKQQAGAVDGKTKPTPTTTVTITDLDVFDCPHCCEKLRIPIYQCLNGHIACNSCRQKFNQKCPTCSRTIKCRCRAIEKVLEASQVSCRNLKYGCQHIMRFCDKMAHEHACVYTACSCPMRDCNFVDSASNLYQHFGKEHKHNGKDFDFNCRFFVRIDRNTRFSFLRESTSGTVFVLNQFSVHERSAVSVVLIAPKSSTGKYRYELQVDNGEASFSMESAVASVTKFDYSPTKYFLVVEDILSSFWPVMLQIRIYHDLRSEGNP